MSLARRVLLVSPGAASTGGIQSYNRSLVLALQQLLAADGGTLETLLLDDADGDVDPRYLVAGQPAPRGYRGRRLPFTLAVLGRARRFAPDLVLFAHVHFAALGPIVRALRPGAAQWFIAYGLDAWERLSAPRRRGLAAAEGVLSISDDTTDRFARANDVDLGRIHPLPCTLDPYWSLPAEGTRGAANGTTLLSVSRLDARDPYKGIDRVIAVLPEVLQRHPTTTYEIVGDGSDRPRLEALARSAGVFARVRFRGRVPELELAEAYARASLFVLPSTCEGFGIVYLEAAAFSTPSLAAREGGATEVVEDGVTGRLVDPSDGPALAAAVSGLLDRPDELARLGAAARRRLEERFVFPVFRARLGRLLAPAAVGR